MFSRLVRRVTVLLRGSVFLALYLGAASAFLPAATEIEIRRHGSMWAVVEADGTIRINGSMVGRFEDDGTVRKNGSMVGEVEPGGIIRKHGSMVGEIEQGGTLRIRGSMRGEIESNGTIRLEGSLWGEARPCCGTYADLRAVAAVIVFFTGEFLPAK
ncbi:MAG: hypothetical protein KA419_06620 [Acidobacteria bacterium]|nr:hypothetical protein [Acidobacteriota bacterium]